MNITIDEQMVVFRDKCPFRRINTDKYGMKLFCACDFTNGYQLGAIPYTCKDGNVRATAGLGSRIVLKLCEPYFGSNGNITFDNYFTNMNLAKELLQNKITSVGTICKNKTCVPKEFLPNRSRLEFSSLIGFQKNCSLVSYVSKKKKTVILLSTMYHTPNVTSNEIMKPEIILDYNMTKGGVDTFDQMIHEYSSKRKTNRWPLAFFFNLLDTYALAAYIIWTEKIQIGILKLITQGLQRFS